MKLRGAWWFAPVGAGLWLAACNSDEPPPPAAAGGASNPASSHRAGAGYIAGSVSGPSAAGEPSSLADGGASIDLLPIGQLGGGNFAEAAGGAPPNPRPDCDPELGWGDAKLLAFISTSADERLLTMTHDELTLVFLRDGALLLADRLSADADFERSAPLSLPAGFSAARGLALGAGGLTLVLVSDDGSSFAELSRASRESTFGSEPDAARFAAINDARTFTGGELSSPVLSEDGKTFFYVERSADRSDVWRANGAELDERTRLDAVTLGASDGRAKLTLSVSTDERALFVFDEALAHVVGLWSKTPAAEFTRAVQLNDLESAFTNADCSRLYGTRTNGASLDVVIETPN